MVIRLQALEPEVQGGELSSGDSTNTESIKSNMLNLSCYPSVFNHCLQFGSSQIERDVVEMPKPRPKNNCEMDSNKLISIKGSGLKLNSAEDAANLIQKIKSNPEATHIQLCGNSIGVEAIQSIALALEPNTALTVSLYFK